MGVNLELQQKQTQQNLYPQYVLSKDKKAQKNIPLGESLEKEPKIAYSYAYTLFFYIYLSLWKKVF